MLLRRAETLIEGYVGGSRGLSQTLPLILKICFCLCRVMIAVSGQACWPCMGRFEFSRGSVTLVLKETSDMQV